MSLYSARLWLAAAVILQSLVVVLIIVLLTVLLIAPNLKQGAQVAAYG